jgi:hypothetical protein
MESSHHILLHFHYHHRQEWWWYFFNYLEQRLPCFFSIPYFSTLQPLVHNRLNQLRQLWLKLLHWQLSYHLYSSKSHISFNRSALLHWWILGICIQWLLWVIRWWWEQELFQYWQYLAKQLILYITCSFSLSFSFIVYIHYIHFLLYLFLHFFFFHVWVFIDCLNRL